MDTSGSQLPPEQQGRSRRKWREKHINNAYEAQKVRLCDSPRPAASAERRYGPSLAEQACSWRTTSSQALSMCIYSRRRQTLALKGLLTISGTCAI